MQVANVKQTAKTNIVNKSINQVLVEKTKKAKAIKADTNKSQSFSRYLEAYSDCV